ncbi:Transposase (probable), IS891/IS1136/IS1341 domain protein [Candidatus Omnitrophus magneticus]|uniref:Transposase (Probable), IS891/IS1136/IS1341 domain protein n=1 Tax=Candidatus Omnitrophus magneticus TaxID=1609969 RepID=A0A0F0CKZ9_9BACT|nr:Transposase (probable), IS891/IS1136/IS1341 domain protein [Candidatus Omnitrophus magneticus]
MGDVTQVFVPCFSCENVPVKEYAETTKQVGIDVGINSFAVDSDSSSVANPKYYRGGRKGA